MSKHWYKIVGMPQDEEIDWLTPITPNYMLYAMSSGKMVCWDVHQDVGIAEWSPDEQWMSWESRFEPEQRVVYLMMARVLRGRDDEKVMQFELVQIHFPEQKPDSDEQISPSFTTLRSFKALGIVMNVFLLDPEARLLAGLVWIKRLNTIGLYVLLDWDKEEYVSVDTGIKCVSPSHSCGISRPHPLVYHTYSANRTCILCDGSVVIHIREATFVCQHFFPLSVLAQHAYPSDASPSFVPQMSMRLKPTRSISQGFKFPILPSESCVSTPRQHIIHDIPIAGPENPSHPATLPQQEDRTHPIDVIGPPNPWSDDLWYPEIAHFLRQWWPTLPSVPHLRCTVVLLAQYDPRTLATNAPFEIVRVPDQVVEDESATGAPREQPLFAVDFGHAAWLEHVRTAPTRRAARSRTNTGRSGSGSSRSLACGWRVTAMWCAAGSGAAGGPTGRSRWRARCGRWRSRMSLTWTRWRRSASTRVKAR
ncbi:hypothetical protein BC826DRAFT_289057 [Russula brevipes]|nr:hypothetical protein BC826DRAFT_289057 [Russula brevipes]